MSPVRFALEVFFLTLDLIQTTDDTKQDPNVIGV